MLQLDSALADLVMEIGYPFTTGVEECRNHLVTMGATNISAGGVARVLSMMVRYHTGLNSAYWAGTTDPSPPKDKPLEPPQPSGWNVEVFVQTLKEMVSKHLFSHNTLFLLNIHVWMDLVLNSGVNLNDKTALE